MSDRAEPIDCPRCGHEIRLVLRYGGKRLVAARHRTNRATRSHECVGCSDCSDRRREEARRFTERHHE